MESIISYVVGGQIKDFNGKLKGSYDLNGKLVVQYMINLGPGKIACFDGLSKIAKLPNVIDIQQRHFVGETIENTGDIKHRAGEISIIGSRDLTDIENTIQFIQDNLIVKDSDGNNMLISPFLAENMETYYRN